MFPIAWTTSEAVKACNHVGEHGDRDERQKDEGKDTCEDCKDNEHG